MEGKRWGFSSNDELLSNMRIQISEADLADKLYLCNKKTKKSKIDAKTHGRQ